LDVWGPFPTHETANGFKSLAEGIGAHCDRFNLLDDNTPAADNAEEPPSSRFRHKLLSLSGFPAECCANYGRNPRFASTPGGRPLEKIVRAAKCARSGSHFDEDNP
jgi:hypothetical protein